MARPYLEYVQVDDLIGHAGGDPWAVDESLQSGSPTQINFLAQAFHQAAGSATAAEETFQIAQQHFQEYNRENGEQPINNGAEVQRVKDGLQATTNNSGGSPPTWKVSLRHWLKLDKRRTTTSRHLTPTYKRSTT